MAQVPVQKIGENKPALTPVLEGLQETYDRIRKRAFELFERRGGTPGFELDDWLQAERDLFWVPQAEVSETETEFKLKVAVPGFGAKDLDITAQPEEILVQGNAGKREEQTEDGVMYSEFGRKELYRRFVLATPIEIGSVSANVENGLLTVIARKERVITKKVAVAA